MLPQEIVNGACMVKGEASSKKCKDTSGGALKKKPGKKSRSSFGEVADADGVTLLMRVTSMATTALQE